METKFGSRVKDNNSHSTPKFLAGSSNSGVRQFFPQTPLFFQFASPVETVNKLQLVVCLKP